MTAEVWKTSAGVILGAREYEEGINVRTYCGCCDVWSEGDGVLHFVTPFHQQIEKQKFPAGLPREYVIEQHTGNRAVEAIKAVRT